MTTTLKNLVTKTATVRSAMLPTPADRIGLGLAVATYPASVLSPERLDSESNPGGSRQVLTAESMREHHPAMATARPPAGSAGRDSSGSSAHRWQKSFTATKRQAAIGRLTSLSAAAMSRMSFPAAAIVCERIGDCQSPDRRDDRRAAMPGETNPTAAAAI